MKLFSDGCGGFKRPCCPLRCGCPKPDRMPGVYAQFATASNPGANTFVPFYRAFGVEEIGLQEGLKIVLPAGYLYLINYVFLATPEANSFMQLVPYLNGAAQLLYAFYAPTGVERNASAAGSFTTNVAAREDAELAFWVTYPEKARNLDLSGTVSVTALDKLVGGDRALCRKPLRQ